MLFFVYIDKHADHVKICIYIDSWYTLSVTMTLQNET